MRAEWTSRGKRHIVSVTRPRDAIFKHRVRFVIPLTLLINAERVHLQEK